MNLGEQIGPLPLGAWIGVVAGGIGIGYLGRRKRAAEVTAAPVPADTAQWQSSQGAVHYVGTGTTTAGTPKYATNEEWAAAATAYLIGKGTFANRATNAISHVLYPDSAHPTTAEDSALYNMAAAGIGLPPSLPAQAFIPDPPTDNKVATFLTNTYRAFTGGIPAATYYQYDPATSPMGLHGLAVRYDEQGKPIAAGFVDEYGKTFVLSPEQVAALPPGT